jgi:hypothetical protein
MVKPIAPSAVPDYSAGHFDLKLWCGPFYHQIRGSGRSSDFGSVRIFWAADAHHLRFAQSRAPGRKVSDEFTVPLSRGHHREVHRCGDEAKWWTNANVDPTVTARMLWLETHPIPMGSVRTKTL